jgi:hypothetical protein
MASNAFYKTTFHSSTFNLHSPSSIMEKKCVNGAPEGAQATPHLDVLQTHLSHLGLQLDEEGVVRWERSNKLHPRNWPMARKMYDISLIVILDFATYVLFQFSNHITGIWSD